MIKCNILVGNFEGFYDWECNIHKIGFQEESNNVGTPLVCPIGKLLQKNDYLEKSNIELKSQISTLEAISRERIFSH